MIDEKMRLDGESTPSTDNVLIDDTSKECTSMQAWIWYPQRQGCARAGFQFLAPRPCKLQRMNHESFTYQTKGCDSREA